MSSQILDNHGRLIDYLRLSVTDRCNLRCFYCMPESGIQYLPRKELLTYEEMEWMIHLLVDLGIRKIRITGGEPFVRNDLTGFLHRISKINGLESINITTNGSLVSPYIKDLKSIGIKNINLSLDTLRPDVFENITRRNDFDRILESFYQLLAADFNIKINMVVMNDFNVEDIIPMAELTKDLPVSVRFIEEMPFNGGKEKKQSIFSYKQIFKLLKDNYQKSLLELKAPDHSTSINYQVKDYNGNIGIIAAFSRTFCGTCNRIRVTAQGMMKTCLYDQGVLNLKQIIRAGSDKDQVKSMILKAIGNRAKNGFIAEKNNRIISSFNESMATIGG